MQTNILITSHVHISIKLSSCKLLLRSILTYI